ncbi:MAG: hypothetical protein EBS42_04290 [Caulobacteraceae bacterium]|nr:hypothetical protein [Caulobacteraceae bacterium]
MSSRDLDPIVTSNLSISDKIRRLDRAGQPRAEIARLLGKRYQHVRNVLEADRVRAEASARTSRAEIDEAPAPIPGGAPVRADPALTGGYLRLVVGPEGTLTLPAQLVSAMGLGVGEAVVAHVRDRGLSIISARESMLQAQARVLARIPAGASLSEDLMADRRRENRTRDLG